jgi:hypothetical protein
MAVKVPLRKGRHGQVKDFFISYTGKDKQWAEWIGRQLEDEMYSVVLQDWDFGAGQNFVGNMDEASRNSRRTIVVLSPDYFKARFTLSEWTAAFRRDPKGEKGILLPVLVHECKKELNGLLGPIAYINLIGQDEATARQRLIDGVKGPQRPTAPPPFPGP